MDEANGVPIIDSGRIPLLATKLFIPRLQQSLVSRRRLVERLSEGLHHQTTIVSAPAGFGKTTLLSTWTQGLEVPVAWLSLDRADNDPIRFLSYLVAALQKIDPTIGQDVQRALAASPPPQIDAAVVALINDMAALPTDFVLILDDFHAIDEANIQVAVQNMVDYQPPQMHLIIATREDPPLPLARLRARGRLVELRAQDLRFTFEETAIFLREVMGLALRTQDIYELDAGIEGWIAGLQLAALSMQRRRNPADLIRTLSGSHHFILSYLTDEVLRHLPPEVQTFLLETSVLDRLNGPLCDAVTGREDSGAMLEHLYTSNAFVIPLDEEHVWYRYHHLFADLLRNQLDRTQPQRAAALHTRASEWFERQGSAVEAIEHAFAASDYQLAVRLLESHARSVTLQGYAQTMENWLHRLPQGWRVAGPRANLAFSWSLLLRGQLVEAELHLQNTEAAISELSHADDQIEVLSIRAEGRSLRAMLLSMRGEAAKGCELAEEAVALAPREDLYSQGTARFSLASAYLYAGKIVPAIVAYREALPLCQSSGNTTASLLTVANLALLYIVRGELRAGADVCRQAIETAEESGDVLSPALSTVYSNYGAVLYEWGELDASQRSAQRGLELSKRGGHTAAVAFANVVLSRLFQTAGDMAGAQAALDAATQMVLRNVPDWVGPRVVAQQVALAIAQGDEATALRVLAGSGVHLEDPVSDMRELLHITYLRLLHYQGLKTSHATYLNQALDLASRLLVSAESVGRIGRMLEILVLRALVYQAMGDGERALADLGRALELAEPEGYLRLFVDEGTPMARLLKMALRRGVQKAYIVKLLAGFPRELATTPLPKSDLGEPLTEREIDVLRLLAEGLTYENIARQLVLSLNTVRFHVKGIYGKLGVERRVEAVDRARALGLL